jgi:hypothetical protein
VGGYLNYETLELNGDFALICLHLVFVVFLDPFTSVISPRSGIEYLSGQAS